MTNNNGNQIKVLKNFDYKNQLLGKVINYDEIVVYNEVLDVKDVPIKNNNVYDVEPDKIKDSNYYYEPFNNPDYNSEKVFRKFDIKTAQN